MISSLNWSFLLNRHKMCALHHEQSLRGAKTDTIRMARNSDSRSVGLKCHVVAIVTTHISICDEDMRLKMTKPHTSTQCRSVQKWWQPSHSSGPCAHCVTVYGVSLRTAECHCEYFDRANKGSQEEGYSCEQLINVNHSVLVYKWNDKNCVTNILESF